MTTPNPQTPGWPRDPQEADWRWRIETFHVQSTDDRSTAIVTLTDRDGEHRRAHGTGDNPLHALLDALAGVTGYPTTMRQAKIYSSQNDGRNRSQAHIQLTNEAGDSAAGFGWGDTDHQAFLIAALRIANAWEAAVETDAYCARRTPHHFGRYFAPREAIKAAA